jgi:hypothetical protein
MALASPLVEPVPGDRAYWFWTARAAGVALAVAAVFWPRVQRTALMGVTLFLVLVPCLLQMRYRYWTGPETWCHDSVLQFEEAIQMVRHHQNPYREDFSETSLPHWKGWKDNPAVHHFVYPPLLLYLSVPIEAASRAFLWPMPETLGKVGTRFYDQRLVVIAFFLGLLALVSHHLRDHPHRIGLTALIVLNPWVGPFVVEGHNDVAMLFWVAVAWFAYERDRRRAAPLQGFASRPRRSCLMTARGVRPPEGVAGLPEFLPRSCSRRRRPCVDAPSFLTTPGAPAGWAPSIRDPRLGRPGIRSLVLALGLAKSPQGISRSGSSGGGVSRVIRVRPKKEPGNGGCSSGRPASSRCSSAGSSTTTTSGRAVDRGSFPNIGETSPAASSTSAGS